MSLNIGGTNMGKENGKDKKVELVEVWCPKCGYKKIIHMPKEEVPKCPKCGTQMMISELLDEGKYY